MSGCCKHVAALLYHAANQVLAPECTSKLQTWHQPSKSARDASKPALLRDIQIKKVTAETNLSTSCKLKRRGDFDPRLPNRRRKKSIHDFNLDKLAAATNGKCGLLRYNLRKPDDSLFDVPDLTDIACTIQVESTHPFYVSDVESAYQASSNIQELFNHLSLSKDKAAKLAVLTVNQSQSEEWVFHRIGRITSSRIGNCINKVSDKMEVTGATHSAVAEVMGYYEKANAPSLEWGKKKEPEARKIFTLKQRKTHKKLQVDLTGLWISTESPFIAASPDGLVSCSCCGKGCIEIKCPWKYRHLSVSDYIRQPESCLFMTSDNKPALKTDHVYFAQVQVHMYCTETNFCDFILFTAASTDNILIVRVKPDHAYVKKIIDKASVFFRQCIIPEFQSRAVEEKVRLHYVGRVLNGMLDQVELQVKFENPGENTDFLCGICSLTWSDKENCIQCDKCQMWYHYSCANVTGKEEFLFNDSEWFCSVCNSC